MSNANDPRLDGVYQRVLGAAPVRPARGHGLAAAVLVGVTREGRVVPVLAVPSVEGEDPWEFAREVVRTTLEQLEAGHVSTKPRPVP